MTESATYIHQLTPATPLGSTTARDGDNEIRQLKSVLQANFPYLTGPLAATDTELNYVDGVTSGIQAQLNLKAPLASPTFSGTATFSAIILVPTPTANMHAATKLYVDSAAFSAALPAQATAARKVISTDGSNAAWASTFGAASTLTTSQLAIVRARYCVDTSGGAFTLTLPASPAADDWVWIVDTGGACATLNLTIGRNGSLIMGLSEDMTFDSNNASILLIYHTSKGWTLS